MSGIAESRELPNIHVDRESDYYGNDRLKKKQSKLKNQIDNVLGNRPVNRNSANLSKMR